ncbi:hypothetical protein K466DRAFT_477781 [Polyporus arcularius HHB13444]|uniref:RRM domain-containing protein n=1 Tax=Polyporus arcularius HHB13444 TaxID=1314778 RepID=A0A5C3PWA5_9APHY|nr:hypothetical protein K466DRAFT_477781 [Polyporus arcularius HHB13444]
MKKAEVKDRRWSFVYVGNLSSAVTEDQLEEKFERFGPIRLIKIRASSGICVPTANLPRPYFGFGAPLEGTHYATIEFSSPNAARKALEYNNTPFAGRNIIVSFNAIDLPETTEIMKSLVEKKKKKIQQKAPEPLQTLAEMRTLWKIKFGQIKRLTVERTEYISDGQKAPTDPGQVMAHLAKRIGLLPDSNCNSTESEDGHNMFTYPQTLA